ncbi:hypothetical protein [Aquamicrobium sp. LC103]|uniref:hypothetical protein n=1 Tax=Aquamicrobium sp. LC103 TaxID=1120658 RepID=UPI00109D72D0|nr:hypothetical protein [Aquamicrobium sp. LC103]TKT69071.1 hypothetical protein XW59_029150 [Aquamicrobium sp. LC103]
MDQVQLLTVEDSFQISGQGLVVLPDFPSPPSNWRGGSEMATVVKPDGSRLTAHLNLFTAHFNIRDPQVPLEKRWRIVPTFPDLQREDVPIGSQVLVSASVVEAIKRAN